MKRHHKEPLQYNKRIIYYSYLPPDIIDIIISFMRIKDIYSGPAFVNKEWLQVYKNRKEKENIIINEFIHKEEVMQHRLVIYENKEEIEYPIYYHEKKLCVLAFLFKDTILFNRYYKKEYAFSIIIRKFQIEANKWCDQSCMHKRSIYSNSDGKFNLFKMTKKDFIWSSPETKFKDNRIYRLLFTKWLCGYETMYVCNGCRTIEDLFAKYFIGKDINAMVIQEFLEYKNLFMDYYDYYNRNYPDDDEINDLLSEYKNYISKYNFY